MEPVELLRVHECDDGIFNKEWWEYSEYPRGVCEYPLVPCRTQASWWCVECGGVVCDKHRKNHADSRWHRELIMEKKGPPLVE